MYLIFKLFHGYLLEKMKSRKNDEMTAITPLGPKIAQCYSGPPVIKIFFYSHINFRLEISPRARTERECQDYSIRFMIFSQKNCYFNLQTYLLNLHVNMYFD